LRPHASFTTDHTARVPHTETNLSIATWDIYQILFGTTFNIKQSQITLGIGYAFGSDNFNLKNLIFDPDRGHIPKTRLESVDFKYQNLKFVFGFSI
jgi:hypothetical protein